MPVRRALIADVRRGLSAHPKQLSARWFYDELGSQLFEAICHLPWYGLTRAENGLLRRHGAALARLAPSPAQILELGGGSGEKAARIVAPLLRRQGRVTAHLVDLSATALDEAATRLQALRRVRVVPHRVDYFAALRLIRRLPRRGGGLLVLFLGSNLGNFEPSACAGFLRALARAMQPGDALLLGADLVKPAALLRRAYDDPLGLTSAFNLNLLRRLNDELGADFDLAAFRHKAVWNRRAARVEMHLVSRRAQQVRIPAARLTVTFRRGETLWTESSHKFTRDGLRALGAAAGFEVRRQWVDTRARFALTLFGRQVAA